MRDPFTVLLHSAKDVQMNLPDVRFKTMYTPKNQNESLILKFACWVNSAASTQKAKAIQQARSKTRYMWKMSAITKDCSQDCCRGKKKTKICKRRNDGWGLVQTNSNQMLFHSVIHLAGLNLIKEAKATFFLLCRLKVVGPLLLSSVQRNKHHCLLPCWRHSRNKIDLSTGKQCFVEQGSMGQY